MVCMYGLGVLGADMPSATEQPTALDSDIITMLHPETAFLCLHSGMIVHVRGRKSFSH
jgi:hypothetical protein